MAGSQRQTLLSSGLVQETSLRTSWWLEPTYLFSPSLLFSSSSSSSFSSFLTSHATGFDREARPTCCVRKCVSAGSWEDAVRERCREGRPSPRQGQRLKTEVERE